MHLLNEPVPYSHMTFSLNSVFANKGGFLVGVAGLGGVTSRDGHRAMFPSPSQENFYRQGNSQRRLLKEARYINTSG